MDFSAYVVPLLLLGCSMYALHRKVDVYSALTAGAEGGLGVAMRILPSMIALLSAIYMLRASGALDLLTASLSPLTEILGLPAETTALMLIRPLSGSGALAVGSELMAQYGPDSYIGRVAAVMLGSTETTFYVLAVYFGAAGVKKSRHALPAALCADVAGFLAAAWCTRLFFPP
jgi:spore maturation protein B